MVMGGSITIAAFSHMLITTAAHTRGLGSFGGVWKEIVSPAELKTQFPEFVKAVKEFYGQEDLSLGPDDSESLLGCAISAYGETVPARKRSMFTDRFAFLLGYLGSHEAPVNVGECSESNLERAMGEISWV
ncbi:hypothetical protein R1sor_018178 [Riccia sorocarpa]|uniref:Uncharacterized protein n=1 Tax=Riccia sorocarpa TaxID=122646 RepID=A0ABD3IA03_9MARC